MKAILYIRVSTSSQSLGSQVQEDRLKAFCETQGWEVAEVVSEQASGANNERELLEYAANKASENDWKLVVLRVDRLGRTLSKVAELLERKNLQICVAELGRCLDPFVVGIMACVAQQERSLISQRTKEALEVLKEQGVKLGSPSPENGARASAEVRSNKANETALKFGPVVYNLRLTGLSWAKITPLVSPMIGKSMHQNSIRNLYNRYLALTGLE
jgi:DNA invertase Pin-like site-specific DNA recombinase